MQGLLGAIRGSQSSKEWRACGALIACALAFSLMTVCVKHLGGRLPVAEVVLVRSLISIAMVMAMQIRVIRHWKKAEILIPMVRQKNISPRV